MKRKGFIDLTSKNSGEVYIFARGNGRYELERSIEYSGNNVAVLTGAPAVGEFYLSLPIEMLGFRILKLPFSDMEKIMKVIPFEIENLILENPANIVFDARVLGGSGDAFEVLVTYIEKRALADILSKLSSYHIDPVIATSTELRDIVSGDVGDIGSRLVNPGRLSREDRVNAARKEMDAPTLNLRTGPLAYTKDIEKVESRVKVTGALLLVLALVIIGYFLSGAIMARHEASSIKRDLRNMYTGLFPGEKKITDELYQMKSHMREIKEKSGVMVGVYPLQVLLGISRKMPSGVAFNEVGMNRDMITMKGEASSMGDIDKMKSGLSEFMNGVSVADIKNDAGGKIFFGISAKGLKQ